MRSRKLGSSAYAINRPGKMQTTFSLDDDNRIFAIGVVAPLT